MLRILGANGRAHFRSALLTHFVTDPTDYIYPPMYVTLLISCKERPGAEISDWADGDTGSFDAEMGSVAKMFSAKHTVL